MKKWKNKRKFNQVFNCIYHLLSWMLTPEKSRGTQGEWQRFCTIIIFPCLGREYIFGRNSIPRETLIAGQQSYLFWQWSRNHWLDWLWVREEWLCTKNILILVWIYSEIRKQLKEDVDNVRADHPDFKPGLAIVQVFVQVFCRGNQFSQRD